MSSRLNVILYTLVSSLHTHTDILEPFVPSHLLLQLVEVKRIQADNSVGTAKWRSREMFSFFPQVSGQEGMRCQVHIQKFKTRTIHILLCHRGHLRTTVFNRVEIALEPYSPNLPSTLL